ncbi:MAG TPA: hypothetical protein VN256_20365 [Pyrinomonadaceae bacterium]|nr:hypothetical protein [Pyrinomonadaceae bacterium]
MKGRRHLWLALAACAAAAVLLAAGQDASAQCAMCRSALGGAPEAAKLSARLNLAVLVLLVPPVVIFCGIFYAVFRQLKSRGEEEGPAEVERAAPRRSRLRETAS